MSAKPLALPSTRATSVSSKVAPNSAWRTTVCMLATDFSILSLVFWFAASLHRIVTSNAHATGYWDLLPFLFMTLCGFWIQDLYPGVLIHPAEELRRIFVALTTVLLMASCSALPWHNIDSHSRSVFLFAWVCGSPLVLVARKLIRRLFKSQSWWGISAVILASGRTGQRVTRTLQNSRWGIRVAGILSDDPVDSWPQDLRPLVGSLDLAQELRISRACGYAIVAMPQRGSDQIRNVIQTYCQGFHNILLVPDIPDICSLGVVARQIGGEIGFEVPQHLFQRVPAATKRTLDLISSLLGVILLLPVFLLLVLCVRLSSRGPIFYGQSRLGRNGRTFKALKFRTMVTNADVILAQHLALHPEDLFEWQRDHKLKKDPRVTAVGKWMRRLSLDELPQLFNVLAGHMSLVGPRPIVQAEIAKYGLKYPLYSRVRPGITGLWQVSGRNNTTYEERVTLDEYYVNNWSVWLDIYILVRTLRTVVTAHGAY